jgi:CheY-like chemotaxis protein
MSGRTILVIDDSATIRKLTSTHLGQAGYRVILAESGERGLALAPEVRPDMILLDHQLPGTTGNQVLRRLIEIPGCEHIPVVVSSTLRKQADAEYTDIANVVGSLPKPFTPELLISTVANAIEVGSLVVASQGKGAAVPEVMEAPEEAALSGSCEAFGLREILDLLNNGAKTGALEVEAERDRYRFFLAEGRIQVVLTDGFNPAEVAATLPPGLRDLAPILNFTAGGASAQIDGLVDLLDKNVLDQRMLRSLLRHQAAYLSRQCFTGSPKAFRFEADLAAPSLYTRLPLEMSLAALLVQGSLVCPKEKLLPRTQGTVYVRRGQRGGNLDRTGLSANHMRVLSVLESPRSPETVAEEIGLPEDEVIRVLDGLLLAEWIHATTQSQARQVLVLEDDPASAQMLRELFPPDSPNYTGRVVRDELGLQLLIKRNQPDAVLLSLDDESHRELAVSLRAAENLKASKFIGLTSPESEREAAKLELDALVERPFDALAVLETLDGLFAEAGEESRKPVGAAAVS